jgi:hypothetical protein
MFLIAYLFSSVVNQVGSQNIFLADPHPAGLADSDPRPFKPKVTLNSIFSRKFQYTVQNIEKL